MLKSYYSNNKESLVYDRFKSDTSLDLDFHLHDTFEIYFFISGNVNYIIEKRVYSLKYGDLLIINSDEVHKPTFQSNEAYERITIHFDSAIPNMFNISGQNLLNCFVNRPKGEKNKTSLNNRQLEQISKFFIKIEQAEKNTNTWSSLVKLTSFIELLIFINSIYDESQIRDEPEYIPEKLAPVLNYIRMNLTNDLSLKTLEQTFYINRYHLCKLVKKFTGCSLHEYIINERISKAKLLLSSGSSVTEACISSGFNDYSNFIHMFKKSVGVTPDSFRKSITNNMI
ncbi:MAG: AraC family transcriptional regulator [Clostridiaceae bacterium]